jgi:membrane protease YdiL (CAAX protease family)
MKFKQLFRDLFRWQPTKETLVAVLAGFLVLGLSWAMIPTRGIPWLSIIIRDELMIFLVGIAFPVWYIHRTGNDYEAFGLTLRHWHIYLIINLILSILLFLLFLSGSPLPSDFGIGASELWQILFIMLAGVFEVVFFYSFLRTLFERAFGIIPAILLAAGFYAFHHIGFQPEYAKLFPIGLIYAITFRLGNSALLIYPFFWGVGGCYDVLIQSQVVSEIQYPEVRSMVLVAILAMSIPMLLRGETGE